MCPDRILISPGPSTPHEAGISIDLFRHFTGKLPILGVCLGHQALGAAFGGSVVRAPHLMHGKTSQITHDGRTVFKDLQLPFTATRYHSLIVQESALPSELQVSAWTTESDGSRTIMGLRHREYPVEGVQFHPEIVLKGEVKQFLGNARGSLLEVETQILISRKLGYIVEERCAGLLQRSKELGRILNGLINALRR